jgi:hypothetical protein
MQTVEFENLRIGKTYFIEILDYGLRTKLSGTFIGADTNNNNTCTSQLCSCQILKCFKNIRLIKPPRLLSIDENNGFGINRFRFFLVKQHDIQQDMEVRAINTWIRRITGEQYFSYLDL